MSKRKMNFDTKVIHAGQPHPRIEGAVNVPIFQSSTFEYKGQKNYDDLVYVRLNNTPSHKSVSNKIAQLEGAEKAVVTSSGMSAITTTLLHFLNAGDHILAHKNLYGGTAHFMKHGLPSYGIEVDLIDARNPDNWEKKLKDNTKVIYVETMTNPLVEVVELEAIVNFAKSNNLISIIDNTFASPVIFCPIKFGFDISLHSATKYLNGHSDLAAGAIIGTEKNIKAISSTLNHLGGSLDPNTCYLLDRGIKTLSVRMERQCFNALKIAEFLNDHPGVESVNYPGLKSNPNHDRAKRFLCGYGAMLSFILKGSEQTANDFINKLEIPVHTWSLGGVESLVVRPAQTTHSNFTDEELFEAGIDRRLIRYSVGIESIDDIIEDFKFAIDD